MKKAVKVYIHGAVQGVFFRTFIKESADKLKVYGYVRNLEDGRVEAWFEGDSKVVNNMIEVCRAGPPHSQIKRIDIVDEKLQDMKEFKILHI